MKFLTSASAGLLILLIFSGCTSVKRFKTAHYKGEDHGLVDIELFGASLALTEPGIEGKNLWDLSADAQTQLIRIYNERYPENGQFNRVLNQVYILEGKPLQADFTGRDLRMVFTISREKDYTVIGEGGSRFSPADRIQSLKFSLEIPAEYGLQFRDWNRYSTEYGEFEIADVSFSRNIDLGADISTEFVDGVIKSSSGRKEDQALRNRYLKLNGSISPLRLEMEAEGCREIDLAGNVQADVSLEFEGFPERIAQAVYAPGQGDSAPQLLDLLFTDVLVPRIKDVPDSLMAVLEMEYVYRHVEAGWKTFQEWDDRVAFYSGRVQKKVPLFKKADYLPPIFCIGEEGGETLRIRLASGEEFSLQFLDYREAGRFLNWLYSVGSGHGGIDGKSGLIEIGGSTLLWNNRLLSPAMLSSMKKPAVLPVY